MVRMMKYLDFSQSVRNALNGFFDKLCNLVQYNNITVKDVNDYANISSAIANKNAGQVSYNRFKWLFLVELSSQRVWGGDFILPLECDLKATFC